MQGYRLPITSYPMPAIFLTTNSMHTFNPIIAPYLITQVSVSQTPPNHSS